MRKILLGGETEYAIGATRIELDLRFGQLGPPGIFDHLDRARVLTHRVAGVEAIDAAVETPPQGTRATLRGNVVRRLTAEKTQYRAEWTRIVDVDHHQVLDLGDPFETEERWSSLDEVARPWRHTATARLASLFQD